MMRQAHGVYVALENAQMRGVLKINMPKTNMPKINGTNNRHERDRASWPALSRSKIKRVATPETKNKSDKRHGLVSSIKGSKNPDARGLFTCQPQLT